MKRDISKVKLEVLSMKNAAKYIASTPMGDNSLFQGFKIFKPDFINHRLISKRREYNQSNLESTFEEQEMNELYDSDYDKGIFAIYKNAFIGANIFRWECTSFWAYHHRLIDVHHDWWKSGIAYQLMNIAKEAPEFNKKILRFGDFHNEAAEKIIYNAFKDTKKQAVIPLLGNQNLPSELKFYDIG